MPVLLTSTSTPPKRSTAAATSACACSRSVIWPATISVRSPVGSSSACAASSTARRVPLRTTLRALVEEPPRGRAADAAAAAGDQDDLAVEVCLRTQYTCMCT